MNTYMDVILAELLSQTLSKGTFCWMACGECTEHIAAPDTRSSTCEYQGATFSFGIQWISFELRYDCMWKRESGNSVILESQVDIFRGDFEERFADQMCCVKYGYTQDVGLSGEVLANAGKCRCDCISSIGRYRERRSLDMHSSESGWYEDIRYFYTSPPASLISLTSLVNESPLERAIKAML